MPNPVAIVTGASRGIGRAIAVKLSEDYDVVVNYRSSETQAEQTVQQIAAGGGQAVAVQGDVGSETDRAGLIDATLQRFRRIDLLVNNAGVTSQGRKDLLDADESSWNTVFDTNLKGPFFLSQRAAKEMIRLTEEGLTTGGAIVNVSSISAYATSSNRADYCMAKAAMQMMTWLFAERLAEEQIRVYEVRPGVIASDMTAPVQEKYDRLIADGLSPIRRWGQPEDVARVVATLVSSAFAFSTGDSINVDGGFHIRRL